MESTAAGQTFWALTLNISSYLATVPASIPSKGLPQGQLLYDKYRTLSSLLNLKTGVASLFKLAEEKGVKLNWINCGLCVDERGSGDWIEGPRRGAPKDFLEASLSSDATLVIATK